MKVVFEDDNGNELADLYLGRESQEAFIRGDRLIIDVHDYDQINGLLPRASVATINGESKLVHGVIDERLHGGADKAQAARSNRNISGLGNVAPAPESRHQSIYGESLIDYADRRYESLKRLPIQYLGVIAVVSDYLEGQKS